MAEKLILRDEDYYNALLASINTNEAGFFSDLFNCWSGKYPNDLLNELYRADLLSFQNQKESALKILSELLKRDPEFLKAYQKIEKLKKFQDNNENSSMIYILSGEVIDINKVYPWAVTLRAIRTEVRKGSIAKAKVLLKSLLEKNTDHILIAIEHCKITRLLKDYIALLHFSEKYHNKWPDCLHFRLLMAEGKMETGKEAEAVEILHECVLTDPGGQVPIRLWGFNHQYKQLWPTDRCVEINFQIPASISVPMNWNKLSSGEKKIVGEKSIEKKPLEIDLTNDSIKIKKNSGKILFENEPVYVILTTRMGLEKQYGPKTTKLIIEKLEELSQQVDKKLEWSSIVFIPDDIGFISQFEMEPIKSNDPWKIKLSLTDLDRSLKERSKMIGAVVIIGGDSIVPFHRLPNPTDDSDREVLSDNPYATSSGNFLLPEWSVGRIPGEKGPDAGLILEQIRQINAFHKSIDRQQTGWSSFFRNISKWFNLTYLISELVKKPKNFGYSAAVWRRSSLAAFRPIGKGSDLRVAPPFDFQNIDIENFFKAKCAFFNLHGLADTPEWYGQRDFSEPSEGPDFPVAINAGQIINSRNNIDLLFTEACYGAYILDKTIDNSIAMKMISIACQGFIGSTCIAYGSVFTPLIGADLLAFIFWKYLKDGYSFGESLLQAKNGLIKVMSQRQGYLDGEDQKTIISFVLYGDPLSYLEPNIYLDRKLIREEPRIYVNLMNDKDGYLTKNSRISENAAKNLNEILQAYMPSIEKASISIREHQIRIEKIINGNEINGDQFFSSSQTTSNRTQIMYKQSTKSSQHQHNQFAKVTLDENGKLIKLAVSR